MSRLPGAAWSFYSSTLWLLLLAALLTLALAGWQWQRGAGKAAQLAQFAAGAQRLQSLPSALNATPDMRLVPLSARPVGAPLLLDNSLLDDGRVGVLVLQPYQLADGRALLVNLGWLASDRLAALPVAGPLQTLGRWMPAPRRFTLPGALAGSAGRVDEIDWPALRQRLAQPLYDGVLVLAHSPAPLQPWPARPDADPARHYGYALQWLLMCLGLLYAAGRVYRRRRQP